MSFGLSRPVQSDIVIKKSRFIGCVQSVADRAEALNLVASLRMQHPSATHVCWALLAGGQSAANDDGEPSGTAGRPMLEVLRRQQLDGVLATVVRYYGGVKLGAGGLVRAYTDAVAQALLMAEKIRKVRPAERRCAVPYSMEGMVRRELQLAGAAIAQVSHGEAVVFDFGLDSEAMPALVARLNEAGKGALEWLDEAAPLRPVQA